MGELQWGGYNVRHFTRVDMLITCCMEQPGEAEQQRFFAMLQKLNRKTKHGIIASGVVLLLVLAFLYVKVNVTGGYQGVFLLKGERGALLEIRDDLYLGEGYRHNAGLNFEDVIPRRLLRGHLEEPSLTFQWNKKEGAGYVFNYLPGGKRLLTSFGRFIDESGKKVNGLFVGGGLPKHVLEDDIVKMNATGMAYHDGSRWFHIWCNVNETMANSRFESILPSSWRFLGSSVLYTSQTDLILESSHEIIIDGVPLRRERYAAFFAGEPYFILQIRMSNEGDQPATYYYVYGDEPWLGNYGTSGGNVGWAADGLYQFVSRLDTKKYHYAGLFDFENDAIGEGHAYTFTANFIQ